MSNVEIPSNDEIKIFKEEGDEDRLAFESLHSKVRFNIIKHFNDCKVFSPPDHHHHHHYLHHPPPPPPPPAHMHKWLDFGFNGKYLPSPPPPPPPLPPPSLSHLPFSQWYSPHYFNFLSHSLPSPHTLFYSPPPPPTQPQPPSVAPQFSINHHHSTLPTSSIFSHHQQQSNNPNNININTNNHNHNHNHNNHNSHNNDNISDLNHSDNSNSTTNLNSPNSLHNYQHIKKPLNAFMLFMKENRAAVAAESARKESATINQILGKNWHNLSPEEQAKYYEKAKSAREAHREQYPCWTAKDNYANTKKKKKTKREKNTEGEGSLKKCRARFGLDHQASWCKPCRRKKKCIRFSEDSQKAINSI